MIFVTVGTHEQQFNRLLKYIDDLIINQIIKEEVIIQTGYSTYKSNNFTSYDFLSYEEMERYFKDARIVITHGGPSSFIVPLSLGKVPIVVPRRKEYKEHVNDHQFSFINEYINKRNNILVSNTYEDLLDILSNYNKRVYELKKISKKNKSNNKKFNKYLLDEINNIL